MRVEEQRIPAAQKISPPKFLLPKGEASDPRRRGDDSEIYLALDGEVYGPSSIDDVVAAIRTSWFPQGTTFWFEGRLEWRPLSEFTDLLEPAEEITADQPSPNSNILKTKRVQRKSTHPHPPFDNETHTKGSGHFFEQDEPRRNIHKKGNSSSYLGPLISFAVMGLGILVTVGILLFVWII